MMMTNVALQAAAKMWRRLFLGNVAELRDLDALPACVSFSGSTNAADFVVK